MTDHEALRERVARAICRVGCVEMDVPAEACEGVGCAAWPNCAPPAEAIIEIVRAALAAPSPAPDAGRWARIETSGYVTQRDEDFARGRASGIDEAARVCDEVREHDLGPNAVGYPDGISRRWYRTAADRCARDIRALAAQPAPAPPAPAKGEG